MNKLKPTNEIFFDTTVLLAKYKGNKIYARIPQFLNDKNISKVGTAGYCLLECGGLIIENIQYCIHLLKTKKNINDIVNHINNVLPPQQKNKQKWSINILVNVVKKLGNDNQRTILKLKGFKKHFFRDLKKQIDNIENEVSCYWYDNYVKDNMENVKWRKPHCLETNIRCKLNSFFEKHKDIFIKIKEEINSLPNPTKELTDIAGLIGQAEKDSSILCNYKDGCKKFADALIALESKKYCNLLTTNYKESDLFCKVLNQNEYYFSNNPTKEIEKR